MNEGKGAEKGAKLPDDFVLAAGKGFAESYDPRWGGFGKAPKFSRAAGAGLILLAAAQSGNQSLSDKVLHTCRMMAAGGMYDQLGGGFSRYSVDEKWLVPHFEKCSTTMRNSSISISMPDSSAAKSSIMRWCATSSVTFCAT